MNLDGMILSLVLTGILPSFAFAADRFPIYWIAPLGEWFKAAAGDVDGDGLADPMFLSTASASPSAPAQALVRSGVNGTLVHALTPSVPNIWGMLTNTDYQPPGDLDLDGFAEVALYIGNPLPPLTSFVEVRSGSDGSVMAIIPPPLVSGASLIGSAIAGVGDLDGDGWPQLLIRGDYFLTPCSLGHGVYDFEAPGFTLQSFLTTWQCAQEFGSKLGPLDDVDGDGLPDFYVGAPATDVGGIADAGWIGVFSGATGSLLASMSGTSTLELLGGSVAALSDVNGDGKPEIVIPGLGGQVQVAVLSLPSFSTVYTIPGGGEVDSLGDVDGDGLDDFLVRESIPPPPYSERITAISGPTGAPLGSIGQSIPGSILYPWGGLGDVNGDGLGDFAASPGVWPWVNLPPFATQSLWSPWSWPVGAPIPSAFASHVYVSRNLDFVGTPTVGGSAQFELVAPKRAGSPFQIVFSQDFVFPGVPLGPFLFPLAMDGLFWASLSAGTGGVLDATGHASLTLPIPNDPALHGVVFQASGVVYDPAGPLGIGCVLTQLPVPIQ